jgi:Lar family restriction alleviation protein
MVSAGPFSCHDALLQCRQDVEDRATDRSGNPADRHAGRPAPRRPADGPLSRRLFPAATGQALSPCPFCGSIDACFYEHVFAKEFAVLCRQCGAEGPMRASPEEALRLWNDRVSDRNKDQ